jgi:hypothetical protein
VTWGLVVRMLGLVAVAAVSALAVLALAWDRGQESDALTPRLPPAESAPGDEPRVGADPVSPLPSPAESPTGIVARVTLSPRIIFFGDTMQLLVDVLLDRGRVDPDSVRIAAQLVPWEIVGSPRRDRRDAEGTTHLRWTYTLRCLTGGCAPPRTAAPLEFDPARVSYAAPSAGTGERSSITVEFPVLVVYSRYTAASFEDTADTPAPWRADVSTLPAVSYRLSPNLALVLLLGASALLVAAAGVLVYAAWPRRAPAPPPEPEPEPFPSLTPLEQALALLEESVRTDGAGDQRRALELVAEELEEWGDEDLAGAARVLAWSEGIPEPEETRELAGRVRAELERELGERAELDQNGAGRVV